MSTKHWHNSFLQQAYMTRDHIKLNIGKKWYVHGDGFPEETGEYRKCITNF
jgi:hypothetical protein